jgi:hypothetical protein
MGRISEVIKHMSNSLRVADLVLPPSEGCEHMYKRETLELVVITIHSLSLYSNIYIVYLYVLQLLSWNKHYLVSVSC